MKIKLRSLEFEKLLYLKGYTKATFAEKLGISRQLIYAYTGNKCSPKVHLAHRMCNELDCELEDIFEFKAK